jgi:ketosteroid isomerase-like protein
VLTKQDVREVIAVYIQAWQSQDPDLIVTIFTEAATYHERVMQDPIPNREAIRQYWQSKVVGAQANITCRLLNLYLDGDTAIAEWEAEFDDMAQGLRKRMREIAVLTFEPCCPRHGAEHPRGYLISSLREYWASETVATVAMTDRRE